MSPLRSLPAALLTLTLAAAPAGAAVAPVPDRGPRAETAGSTGLERVAPSSTSVSPLGFYWQLTAPQPVTPGAFLMALPVRHHERRAEGTRSDQQFFQISSTGSNDVPSAALAAYHHAADVMAQEQPGCQISWTMLAAIGRVESDHGRFGGAQLGSDGISRPAILGPVLDGTGAFAAIRDSDHGALDGNKVWDRAVGQMQFLPSTWAAVGRDGDGDGVRNPQDINDSALGAAVYLCGAGGSLATQAGMARAAFRYNHSDYYVALVLSFQSGYSTGVFAVPSPPPPPAAQQTKAKKQKAAHHSTAVHVATTHASGTPSTGSGTTPVTPTTTPKPSPRPSPTPSPTPTPSPSPTPQVGDFTGILRSDNNGGYTLDNVPLDLGTGRMSDQAPGDYDGDGTVETVRAELDGLVAGTAPVTVHGSKLNGVITVDKISGLAY